MKYLIGVLIMLSCMNIQAQEVNRSESTMFVMGMGAIGGDLGFEFGIGSGAFMASYGMSSGGDDMPSSGQDPYPNIMIGPNLDKQQTEASELFIGLDLVKIVSYNMELSEEFGGLKVFVGPGFLSKTIKTWKDDTNGTWYDDLKEEKESKTGLKVNVYQEIAQQTSIGVGLSTTGSVTGQMLFSF